MSLFSGAILITAAIAGAIVLGIEPTNSALCSIVVVMYAMASLLFLLVNRKDKWWTILMICWVPPFLAALFLVGIANMANMANLVCVFSMVFPGWVTIFIFILLVRYEMAYDLLHIYRCDSCGSALPGNKKYASCKKCYPES